MSSLTSADKRCLEVVFGMDGGYVLDFSDQGFEEFFDSYGVEIHGSPYQDHGTSKAKKMRAFWNKEPDELVGRVLSDLLDVCEVLYSFNLLEQDAAAFKKSRAIVARLSGISPEETALAGIGIQISALELSNISSLPVDSEVSEIIQDRLTEAQACLKVGAYLSVIFLLGSVLEAALLGAAKSESVKFNQSEHSPKYKNGNVRKLRDWSLADLIDVAYDIKLIKTDSSHFSHALRDFRNYIHPEKQLKQDFKPDQYTSSLCFLALMAALADLSRER